MNLKLCKFLLGVHRKTTNAAVRGELGRYPLLIKVLNLATMYFVRIHSIKEDTIVKMSCNDEFIQTYESSWSNVMKKIYNTFGGLSIKETLEQNYCEKWHTHIESCKSQGKLQIYSHIKRNFRLENYLLQFPTYVRRNFSKLRISAHNLAIETGRYAKPSIPPDKRICFNCKLVEDEFHFFFSCSLYNSKRKVLFKDLSKLLSIDINPSIELFYLLMSGLDGDLEVGRINCNYVNKCFNIRSELLSHKRESDILQRVKSCVTRAGRVSKRPEILDL